MRSRRMAGACAVVVVFAAAACESSVESEAGSGGSGGEGGQLPVECAVETSEPGPHEVTFLLTNPGATPVFLRRDCALNYQVLSCADAYTEPLALSGACTVACGDPTGGCIQCGPCPLDGVEVPSGGQQPDAWSGHHYTFGHTADGCTCRIQHDARAGRYRVKVPVFASAEDAQNGQLSHEATVDFELPAPGGIVDVPLAPAP